MILETLQPRWSECIVAATGPSLTEAVAARCRGSHVIAVNDAYRVLPFADVLYACDRKWWDVHQGCPDFQGEKWSSHSKGNNEKQDIADQYGIRTVQGAEQDTFSMNPSMIHYGSNSGFQAINLAILWGCTRILLVGFDMRTVDGQRHFFGNHPAPLNNHLDYSTLVRHFRKAAKALASGIQIINCTPGSALTCFPFMPLEDALGVPQVC